jgi:bacillithiol system protein YtxJ
VQDARAVSDELEKRTGIAHETPQLLIFRHGQVVWSASHGQIKAEAVEAALAQIDGQKQ